MSKKKKLRRTLKRILREFEDSSTVIGLCRTSELVNGEKSHERFMKLLTQFGDDNYFIFENREDRIAWLKLQIKATKKIRKMP